MGEIDQISGRAPAGMTPAEDRSREMQMEDEALEEYRSLPGRDDWLSAWVADSLEYLTKACAGLEPWRDAGPGSSEVKSGSEEDEERGAA